jgi:hypothetical protein
MLATVIESSSDSIARMNTIIPDRWYIPPPVEAASVRVRSPDGGDRLALIAGLDAERMAEGLIFLSGYAPGVLDAILTATEPCLDDQFPPDSDAEEPYCTRCGAKAGVFIARGSDWLHYEGDPMEGNVEPFESDHAPAIGWRPAEGGALVAF